MDDFIDLDGTCLRCIHDKDVPLDENLVGKMYLAEPPYENVVDFILNGLFPIQCSGCEESEPIGTCNGCLLGPERACYSKKTFVTGRKPVHVAETREWIRKHLHLEDGQYTIHFIGFTDYQTYVDEKSKKLVDLVVESGSSFIRVFEDDEKILEEVEKRLCALDKRQVMHVCFVLVRGGKMWKRDILLI